MEATCFYTLTQGIISWSGYYMHAILALQQSVAG